MRMGELLAVPQYADLLEDDSGTSESEDELSKRPSGTVKSREGWRKEMAKWVQKEQVRSEGSDSDDDELGNITYGRQRSKWFKPRSLDLLFGGWKETDVDEQMRRARRRQAYIHRGSAFDGVVGRRGG
jgi:hypothetical protein